MKTVWVVLISIFSAIILAGAIFFFVGYFKPKPGGVLVETSSPASVYLNGQFVGRSPYSGVYPQNSVALKIVPEDSAFLPFETKLSLSAGIQTVIRREFSKTEEESSGDVISFEKEPGKTSMVVISSPDNAQVSIDGVPRGFSPYKTTIISPAEHQITVKSPGYSDRIMTVKTLNGYRLTVYAKLGKLREEVKEEVVTPTVKTYVEIQETPTGFLRVRTEPGTNGKEIAQVTPGSKYLFLSEDQSGWYEIQYQEPQAGLPNGIVGWVTKEFSKKIEESSV